MTKVEPKASGDPANASYSGKIHRPIVLDSSPVLGHRCYYPRDLKMAVIKAVHKGVKCADVAKQYGLRNSQVVYSILAWNRHQGNHGLTVHGLGTYLKQFEPPEEVRPAEPPTPSGGWCASEASDNLKMLDKFKFKNTGEGLRLSHSQAVMLKSLLESVDTKTLKPELSKTAREGRPSLKSKRLKLKDPAGTFMLKGKKNCKNTKCLVVNKKSIKAAQ